MKIYDIGEDFSAVLGRTQLENAEVSKTVKEIVAAVKKNGDFSLFDCVKRFDNLDVNAENIKVSEEEFDEAYKKIYPELLNALREAKENILKYHTRQAKALQKASKKAAKKETSWVLRPVSRAGIYVPGGTAPYPSSVLMCVLPAIAAGVADVFICCPDPKNPLTLVAARECGIKNVYKCGGAQAIAAMAYGTESVPKADVVAGPGNIYVITAKKEVYGAVAIDMLAGPSEVLIIADGSTPAAWTAADLLSQAEHDKLSASILITTSKEYALEVSAEVEKQIEKLPRAEIAKAAISSNGAAIVAKSLEDAVEISNKIAPEHLELAVENPEKLLPFVKNAGAVFMGRFSPEPVGDYFAGPSHCLPTSGTAKCFSALSADTFLRKMSVINYSEKKFLDAAEHIETLAGAEGFSAHKNAIKIRREKQ